MTRPTPWLVGVAIALLAAAAAAQSDPPEIDPVLADSARNARIDAAVANGLRYLAREQLPQGCWTGDVGHKRMDDYMVFDSAASQRLAGTGHIGVSALCGLAFLADGQTPGRGTHGATLDRALDYVLRSQNEFGYLTDSETRMYSHAFATLFLSQIHGMAMRRRAEVERALRDAVHFIEVCQNEHGAWRYSPFTEESDLSVTVCQVQALRAARNSGIQVSAECIARVRQYLEDSRIESGRHRGAFYYKIHGTAAYTKTSFAINGAAVTSLHSAGVYDEARYGGAVDYLVDQYAAISDAYPDHFYYWYGNYYAAQALHKVGGPRWERYWAALHNDLLRRQNGDGSWTNSVGPGDSFATAVACLLLRIPVMYLPIFQR